MQLHFDDYNGYWYWILDNREIVSPKFVEEEFARSWYKQLFIYFKGCNECINKK